MHWWPKHPNIQNPHEPILKCLRADGSWESVCFRYSQCWYEVMNLLVCTTHRCTYVFVFHVCECDTAYPGEEETGFCRYPRRKRCNMAWVLLRLFYNSWCIKHKGRSRSSYYSFLLTLAQVYYRFDFIYKCVHWRIVHFCHDLCNTLVSLTGQWLFSVEPSVCRMFENPGINMGDCSVCMYCVCDVLCPSNVFSVSLGLCQMLDIFVITTDKKY